MLLVPSQAPALCHFFGGREAGTGGVASIAAGTLFLCLVFAGFAWYAFSAAGRGRALPLLRPVVLAIGLLYALRGLLVLPQLAALVTAPAAHPTQQLAFSLVSLLIGLLHLAGPVLAFTRRSHEWYADRAEETEPLGGNRP
jgi:hypothetical protein